MSYDLAVYASQPLPADELRDLVAETKDLHPEVVDEHEVRVVRGKRRSYSFTVFGPHDVEPDDLPSEVVVHALDPTVGWRVVVEGSDEVEIPHAVRFAKRLAVASEGVAYDEQSDDVLGAKKHRAVKAPSAERVRIVQLEWYSPVAAPPAAPIWLDLATRYFPEALPQRFGTYEPYQYRYDRDGGAPFTDIYERESVTFTCAPPCTGGGLYRAPYGGLVTDTLSIFADTLGDPRWRNTIRRFFTEFAARRGAVLATGEVLRNYRRYARGGVGQDVDTDMSVPLRATDGLLGLPADPVWWTWFGTDYLPLVRDHLPADRVAQRAEGLLFEAADEPADRAQLAASSDPIPRRLRVTAIPAPPNVIASPGAEPADIRLPGYGG